MGENPRRSFHLLLHNVSQLGRPGYWCQLAERRKIAPCMSLLPFSLIKVWIRSRAFFFFLWVWLFEKYMVCLLWAVQDCHSRNAMKGEEPLQIHPDVLYYSQCKRGLLKTGKNAPITVFFQTVCCTYLIKISRLYFNFCLPCLVFPQAICYMQFFFFFEETVLKTLTTSCCCMCSVWFLLYCKRQNAYLKYIFSL